MKIFHFAVYYCHAEIFAMAITAQFVDPDSGGVCTFTPSNPKLASLEPAWQYV